jgi:hypothetical protein
MDLDKWLLDDKIHILQHQIFCIVHTIKYKFKISICFLFKIHTFDLSIKRKTCNSSRSVFEQPHGHPRLYPIFGSYLNWRRLRFVIAYCLKHERHTWWLQLNTIVKFLWKNNSLNRWKFLLNLFTYHIDKYNIHVHLYFLVLLMINIHPK